MVVFCIIYAFPQDRHLRLWNGISVFKLLCSYTGWRYLLFPYIHSIVANREGRERTTKYCIPQEELVHEKYLCQT
jgi:Ca2+/Na+ antiporter